MEKILVVAAHPDDEVLGCGATMAAHARKGDKVHVLILAEGITSRGPERASNKHATSLDGLRQAAEVANKILGVSSLVLNGLPDNRMDSLDLLDVVKVIEALALKIKPDVVYTHHLSDVNIDHQLTHQAVVTAFRPLPKQVVRTILFFEVPSSTNWQVPNSGHVFAPNWHVDVSQTLKLKLRALKAYGSEMRPWPHSRSIKGIEYLARWRGASVGVDAAEAFVLGRRLK